MKKILAIVFALAFSGNQLIGQSPIEIALGATVTIVAVGSDGNVQGHGSGFITSNDGIIVTAAHVIDGASAAIVRLQNGEELPVEGIITFDADKDFAVLRVAGFDLPTVPLGNADDLSVGQRIIVIGAPIDQSLAGTVSDGLIAADRLLGGTRTLQISAPTSPGNSGGPVLTEQGQVIGLVVSGITTEGAENLNFALPINYVRGQLALAATKVLQPFSQGSVRTDRTAARVTEVIARTCTISATELEGTRSRAEAGDVDSQAQLGFLLMGGNSPETNCLPLDHTEAERWNRRAADQGHGRGMNNLSVQYDRGWGVQVDKRESLRLKRLSAGTGYAIAQRVLGAMIMNGTDGVQVDHQEAITLTRLAADQGDNTAQVNLGYWYSLGQGVSQSYTEAVRWYRLAADQGNAFSQNNLGWAYSNGNGVPEDHVTAVRWWRLAADQGQVNAQFGLGLAYSNGSGVPEDHVMAVRWWRLAADQGHASSQGNLGWAYRYANGVPEDYVTAYMWYNLAAAQGNEYGQENKEALEQQMTRSEISEGQRLSREWLENRPPGGN